MKATVMECKNGNAVVLTEDGQFCNVQGSYEVGQIIDYKAAGKAWQPASAKRKLIRRAAAVICAAMVLGSGAAVVMEPAAAMVVSLGDEYAVEYLLDKDGNVLRVEATGEEGESLAEQLTAEGIRGKDINEAIGMTEQITGTIYDASKEPPKVEGKNEKAGSELADEIVKKHSAEKSNAEPAAEAENKNSPVPAGGAQNKASQSEAAPDMEVQPGKEAGKMNAAGNKEEGKTNAADGNAAAPAEITGTAAGTGSAPVNRAGTAERNGAESNTAAAPAGNPGVEF